MDDEEIKRKFKVGDRVRVISKKHLETIYNQELPSDMQCLYGKYAKIIELCKNEDFPYVLDLDDATMAGHEIIAVKMKPAKYDTEKGLRF